MAAKILFENKELYRPRTKLIRAERNAFAAELKNIGFDVFDTATNFVCFRAQGDLETVLAKAFKKKYADRIPEKIAAGKMMFKYFMEHSILVRDFSAHPVLTGCLRITIGTQEENKVILATLKNLIAEVQA